MENVKIITDSASDLPEEIIKQYDIDVLPLTVIENGREYKDGVTIMPEQVFEKMRDGVVFTTSQVTSQDYYDKFEEYVLQDIPCVYVGFSSSLSGCYQASVLAKSQLIERYGQDKCNNLTVIDTKCASLGLGLVVLAAAQEAQKGKSVEEIVAFVHERAQKMSHTFSVFDLRYLYRGGRLNKGTAVVGNLLNIYPILYVDEEGSLKVLEVARGNKKLFKRIMEIMKETGDDLSQQTVGIVYGDNPEMADEFKKMIADQFGTKDFIVRPVGSVIGSHTGPEVISAFFIKK